MRFAYALAVFGVLALVTAATTVSAGERARSCRSSAHDGVCVKSRYYYRRGTRVRGYVARRGGYSYTYADSVNTYGDARSKYGSSVSLRDPSLDWQSQGGPFDSGFFFDSGVAPRGGDAPYQH